jgi:hypothetical protein
MPLILQAELVDFFKDHPEDEQMGEPNMNTNTTTSGSGSGLGSENESKKVKMEVEGTPSTGKE